eukprot:8409374-Alexandrium_andersonii.AAC.1
MRSQFAWAWAGAPAPPQTLPQTIPKALSQTLRQTPPADPSQDTTRISCNGWQWLGQHTLVQSPFAAASWPQFHSALAARCGSSKL